MRDLSKMKSKMFREKMLNQSQIVAHHHGHRDESLKDIIKKEAEDSIVEHF